MAQPKPKHKPIPTNFNLSHSDREVMHDTCMKFGYRATPVLRRFVIQEAQKILASAPVEHKSLQFILNLSPEEKAIVDKAREHSGKSVTQLLAPLFEYFHKGELPDMFKESHEKESE